MLQIKEGVLYIPFGASNTFGTRRHFMEFMSK